MLSRLIYIWFPASKTSAFFLAASSKLGFNETTELCLVSGISKQSSPGAEPPLAAEEPPSRTLLKSTALSASVSPSGTGGQYPPCCFKASRGLKLYSLYSYTSSQPVTQLAASRHLASRARGWQEQGWWPSCRAREGARPQAACSNPHPASRSRFLPWKPPGSRGKASPGFHRQLCCRNPALHRQSGHKVLSHRVPSVGGMTWSRQFGGAAAPWRKIGLAKP